MVRVRSPIWIWMLLFLLFIFRSSSIALSLEAWQLVLLPQLNINEIEFQKFIKMCDKRNFHTSIWMFLCFWMCTCARHFILYTPLDRFNVFDDLLQWAMGIIIFWICLLKKYKFRIQSEMKKIRIVIYRKILRWKAPTGHFYWFTWISMKICAEFWNDARNTRSTIDWRLEAQLCVYLAIIIISIKNNEIYLAKNLFQNRNEWENTAESDFSINKTLHVIKFHWISRLIQYSVDFSLEKLLEMFLCISFKRNNKRTLNIQH